MSSLSSPENINFSSSLQLHSFFLTLANLLISTQQQSSNNPAPKTPNDRYIIQTNKQCRTPSHTTQARLRSNTDVSVAMPEADNRVSNGRLTHFGSINSAA
jgi:hypothetical protein